ncbi:MAG TPA: hypothetical protein V6D10_23665 [Trichocoleus sp.]|jgi:type II secretory ATPase GspE/PulE/Tfp pilus assembly ATPase PilB-like protein
MAASPDDRNALRPSNPTHQRILNQFQGGWVDRLSIDQMFVLIDGVLPFEACLYYQVLPLFLDGNRLNLGMVSPDDASATEYVRRIISYLNYSLVPRPISSEALQVTLTAYLNYVGTDPSAKKNRGSVSFGHHRHSARRAPQELDQSERLTLVVDSPDELDSPEPSIEPDLTLPPPPASSLSFNPTHLPAPSPDPNHSAQPEPPQTGFRVDEGSAESTVSSRSSVPLIQSLPVLQAKANCLSKSVAELASLPPEAMLQELLGRVLLGGIGRLYFEGHTHYGRILWSQNGVLQSVLDNLPISSFQKVIAELKQMAQVPLIFEDYPKQVEIEYLYEQTRIMLRFRFMFNAYGEEATLQVLRGAALKFYERQQITNLERDALGIAKQLQVKLNEIRDRTLSEGNLASSRFDVLPNLNHLLRNIEHQLEELGIDHTNPEHEGE